MDNDNSHNELIAKYLTGNLSDAEQAQFDLWLAKDPANKALLVQMQQIWKNSGKKLSLKDFETDEEWNRLQRRVYKDEEKVKPLWKQTAFYLSLAASVLLIIGFWFYDDVVPEPVDEIAYTTFETDDSVRLIYLPDSSGVWLNVNSSITFPTAFNERTAKLAGEAYFEVVHDTSRTFLLEAGNIQVKVLGTSFNVNAYDSLETVDVVLASGVVQVSGEDKDGVTLSPGERFVYQKKDDEITVMQNGDAQFLSWRLKNNPTVIKERKYPVLFLDNSFDWKKNSINQTVIEGTVANMAMYTSYKNIQLAVTYQTNAGRKVERIITLSSFDAVQPGGVLPYKSSLLDVFSRQKQIDVKVISATPIDE